MQELINWKDYEHFEIENEKVYLIAYKNFNNPKELEVGIYYFKDDKWLDAETLDNIHYLSKNDVIIWIAEPPKAKPYYDVKLLLDKIELLQKTITSMGKILKEKQEMWDYFESRFIKLSTCTPEQKEKCLMFPDHCEGEHCMEWVDLVELLDKATNNGEIK